MNWWIIVLIIGGGLALLYGVYAGVRRVGWLVNGSIVRLLKNLSLLSSVENEQPAPRSLSSLESVLLPRVLQDFPEYNSAVIADRVRRDAKMYYESGAENKVLFSAGTSPQFRESFSAALPSMVKKDVIVHQVALHAYDIRSRDRILTYQAAVQFTDTTDIIRQRRLVLKYIASFTDDPVNEVQNYNCPNCGAPLPIIGSKTCKYCGTALKTPAGLGWVLIDAFEN